MNRLATASLAVALCMPASARAQCADGSPPPCRSMTVAVAPKRANPPLDARAWIVVPFDNVSKSTDIDWLRSGSVNMLYLDMSRWKDIRVIDDERVADLLRETPGLREGAPLSLATSLEIAKRAGAANLVMGDLVKVGNRTAVTAKIFDVRTGQRIRSAREETTIADSVMSIFPRLARKILNVAPPSGANVGSIGTTSVAAYQDYLQGVEALNAFRLADARRHLLRALEQDSAFALAHYKLAVVGGWDAGIDSGSTSHIEAAARLAGSLPPRERALINAMLLFKHQDLARACDAYATLLRSDSTDVEAWYGLADCRYHDNAVEWVDGDSTRPRFRSSLNASVRGFRRALELDPTYQLAYNHIVDAYLSERHSGSRCVNNQCAFYGALPIRIDDTLSLVPLTFADSAALRRQGESYLRTYSKRRNVATAIEVASQWLGASGEPERARLALATAYGTIGANDRAEPLVNAITLNIPSVLAFRAAPARVEVAAKLWRKHLTALYDSVRASSLKLNVPNPQTPVVGLGTTVAVLSPLVGRLAEYDSALGVSAPRTPRERRRALVPRLILGIAGDSIATLDQAAFVEGTATGFAGTGTRNVASSIAFDFRRAGRTWPPIDSLPDTYFQPGFAAIKGDTARVLRAARHLDSLSATLANATMFDSAFTAIAADAYLFARDSAAALRMTRRMLDTVVAYTPLQDRVFGQPYAIIVPRMMILRADLAAALGYKDEAKLWYTRLLDLWQKPSPELQPLASRVRSALQRLTP